MRVIIDHDVIETEDDVTHLFPHDDSVHTVHTRIARREIIMKWCHLSFISYP